MLMKPKFLCPNLEPSAFLFSQRSATYLEHLFLSERRHLSLISVVERRVLRPDRLNGNLVIPVVVDARGRPMAIARINLCHRDELIDSSPGTTTVAELQVNKVNDGEPKLKQIADGRIDMVSVPQLQNPSTWITIDPCDGA